MPAMPLETLTQSALTRARINHVLKYATAGGLFALLMFTTFVLAERYWPSLKGSLTTGCWLAVIAAVSVGILGWLRFSESAGHVAQRLDEHAQTFGALSTWVTMRAMPLRSPLEEAFREAQRLDTLKRLEHVKLSRHLPVRLPEWSSYLWLGLLALSCALLLPPREEAETLDSDGPSISMAKNAGGGTEAGPGKLNSLSGKPDKLEISLLTPTDWLKADVLMQDQETPMAWKEDFLREMEAKLGSLAPENMNSKERELLEQLRRQTSKAAQENKTGIESTAESNGANTAAPKETKINLQGLQTLPKTEAERRAVFQERFPDVQNALEKYFKSVN